MPGERGKGILGRRSGSAPGESLDTRRSYPYLCVQPRDPGALVRRRPAGGRCPLRLRVRAALQPVGITGQGRACSIPSFSEYLTMEQDKVLVGHRQKARDASWILNTQANVDGQIYLATLDITIPMKGLYSGAV